MSKKRQRNLLDSFFTVSQLSSLSNSRYVDLHVCVSGCIELLWMDGHSDSFSPYCGWSRYIVWVNEENYPLIQTCGKNQVHDLAQHLTCSMPPDRKQSVGDKIKTEFAKLKCYLLTWKEEIAKECYSSNVPWKATATEWNLQRIFTSTLSWVMWLR